MNRRTTETIAKVVLVASAAYALNRLWKARNMGVVADVLNGVNAQLVKAKGEIVGKLDDLQTRLDTKGSLDDEDKKAIEDLKGNAGDLDNVVPDAVTVPLPDPVDPPEDGTATPVIDPTNPVEDVPVSETPVQAPDDGTAAPVDSATDPSPAAPVEETPAPATETPATEVPTAETEPEVVDDPSVDNTAGTVGQTDGSTSEAIASGDPIPDPSADNS